MSGFSRDYPQCLLYSNNGCHNNVMNNAFNVIWIVKVKLVNQNKNPTGADPEGWDPKARTHPPPHPIFSVPEIEYFEPYLIFVFGFLLAFAYDIISVILLYFS